MATPYLTLKLEIDWDRDGTYTDESTRVKKLNTRRGRSALLTSGGPERMQAGEMWATLSNTDGRYDPFNTSSPIYPNIMPGRPARVTATRGGVTQPVYQGWLTDVRPSGAARDESVIRAVDGFAFLDMQNCNSATPQADYPVSQALEDLLAQSEWPFVSSAATFPFTFPLTLGSITLENNGDLIGSFSPNPDNTILQEMQGIADAWMGTLFVSASGSLVYRARNTGRTTRLTLTDADVGREFETRMPWQDIYNDVRITPNSTSTVSMSANSTSRANFGRRTLSMQSNPYIEDAAHAANLAGYLILYTPALKRGFRARLVNSYANQFAADLTDRVRLAIDALGVDGLYSLGGIEHEFTPPGNCVTTLVLEPDYYEVAGIGTFPLTFPFTLGW